MITIADPPSTTTGAPSADRYFTNDSFRLRYRDQGRGPPVVLVHGWTLDLDMWEPQLAALSRNFRVIRFDRRGFGLSSGRPALDGDVADLDALCRHLDLWRVALIGMSQGVRSVLAFNAATPARVSCLVLDGPPRIDSGVAAEEDVPVARYRALLRSKGIDAVRHEWATHPLVQLRTGDAGTRRLLKSMLGRYPGADLLNAPLSAGAAPGPIQPESVAQPVLIVTGEHDVPGRVKAAEALARRLPRAERAVIPDAGHLPNLDNPDAYNNLVGAFLARHATALT